MNNSCQTPFLPNFKYIFRGRRPLSISLKKERQKEYFKKYTFGEFNEIFDGILPSSIFTSEFASKRNRIFTSELTFWSFFYQILTGLSCSGVLSAVQCWFESKKRSLPSSNNSAYCQARKRLNLDLLKEIFDATVQYSSQQKCTHELYWGREVKVVDGTTFRLPDTKENQDSYPQHTGAQKGCSFPYTTASVLCSLSTRMVHSFNNGEKNTSEKVLWRETWPAINKEDIILGDRGFCSYVNIASLKKHYGADTFFRLGIKKIDYKNCTKIANNQWLDTWKNPRNKPKYLSDHNRTRFY